MEHFNHDFEIDPAMIEKYHKLRDLVYSCGLEKGVQAYADRYTYHRIQELRVELTPEANKDANAGLRSLIYLACQIERKPD